MSKVKKVDPLKAPPMVSLRASFGLILPYKIIVGATDMERCN